MAAVGVAEGVISMAVEQGIISESALGAIGSESVAESISAWNNLLAGSSGGLKESLKEIGRNKFRETYKPISLRGQAAVSGASIHGGAGGVDVGWLTGMRQRGGGGVSGSSAADAARDQEIIRAGIHDALHPDDQTRGTGDHPRPELTDEEAERQALLGDDALRRAGEQPRSVRQRAIDRGMAIAENIGRWRNIGIALGGAGAGGLGIDRIIKIIDRWGRPTWNIQITPDGRVKVTDDTGKTEIIDPKNPQLTGISTPQSSPVFGGSYGGIQHYGKFRFPKYSRYNYARWAEYTNEAARRTAGGMINQPIAQAVMPTVVRSKGGTGSRTIGVTKTGLGGI